MLIGRISGFTGKKNWMELDISDEDYFRWLKGGDSIQNVFPHLSAGEREFLMTGVTPQEWDAVFGNDDHAYEEDDREYVTDEYSGEHDDEVGPRDGLD